MVLLSPISTSGIGIENPGGRMPNLRAAIRPVGYALIVFLGYYLGAKLGFALTFTPHVISIFWPPNAILLSALLLAPPRRSWIVLLAAFAAHMAVELHAGVPVTMVLCWFISNSVEALIGVLCLRGFSDCPTGFDSFRRVAAFVISAALLAPLISSFLDAAFVTWIGWGTDAFWKVWRVRVLSNIIATLTVSPVIVTVARRAVRFARQLTLRRFVEVLALMAGLGGVIAFEGLSFGPVLVRVCLPFSILLWAAARFGPAVVSFSLLIITIQSISLAARGHGPFVHLAPAQNVVSLQVFFILTSIPLMFLSAVRQEQRCTREVLNESESRFRIAADVAPVMIWMSGTDKLCNFFNKGWLDFTGRTLAEELGNGWAEGVHPEDLKGCLETYVGAFDKRRPFQMEYRLRQGDGHYRWILDHGIPRYSPGGEFLGYIGTATDITDRRSVETALIQSEKRYREVVESQTDLVCRYLPDATLTFVNEAYCRYFGKPREELIGTSLLKLLPAEEQERARNFMSSLVMDPHTVTVERQAIRADGEKRWQQWTIHPAFDELGDLIELQAIARDVTERHKAEEDLRASYQKLSELTTRLAYAQEEERKRVARELHDDFNQRLATHAIGLSYLKQLLPPENVPLLNAVNKLQNEAVGLGEEIRLISHALHPPSFEEAGLADILRSFCGEFGAMTNMNIDLRIQTGKERIPPNVALCCYRVVQEGLRNVKKHSLANSAQVALLADSERLFLLLADEGVGIGSEKIGAPGHLGIASMEERVKLLHGEFHAARRPNGGTLLTVELPIS